MLFFVAFRMITSLPPENKPPASTKTTGSRLFTLVAKLVVTGLCFWYVSTKIDFSNAWATLLTANRVLFGLTVVLYALSKIVSAYRLNIYFGDIRLRLSFLTNLRLYWLGMFYNLFLPGSVGGDAYKVVLLKRRLQAPYKETSVAVLLDRFSGLLGLGLLLAGYGLFLPLPVWLKAALALGSLLAVAVAYIIVRRYFNRFVRNFWPTLLLGFIVQAIQVAGVYFIQAAIGNPTAQHTWAFISLAGAVVSVLPLSLGGGLGTREVVFAESAAFFGLDKGLGVTISLLFYLSGVIASLPGAWYVFKNPLAAKKERLRLEP